jgi:hypothetical protein
MNPDGKEQAGFVRHLRNLCWRCKSVCHAPLIEYFRPIGWSTLFGLFGVSLLVVRKTFSIRQYRQRIERKWNHFKEDSIFIDQSEKKNACDKHEPYRSQRVRCLVYGRKN